MQAWSDVVAKAYAECQKSWGGATVDLLAGEFVNRDSGFAVKSCREPTVELAEDVLPEVFEICLSQFVRQHICSYYFGVFHDDDKGIIQIDAIAIVDTEAEVDAIAEDSGAESAYNFATGNGYFPKGKPGEKKACSMHIATPEEWDEMLSRFTTGRKERGIIR